MAAAPLLCQNQLQGILSWSEGCILRGDIGYYTKVSHYTDWILQVIHTNWTIFIPCSSSLRTCLPCSNLTLPFLVTSEQDGNRVLAIRSFLFLLFSWFLLSSVCPSLNDHQRIWAGEWSHKWNNFSPLPSSLPTSYLPVWFPQTFLELFFSHHSPEDTWASGMWQWNCEHFYGDSFCPISLSA